LRAIIVEPSKLARFPTNSVVQGIKGASSFGDLRIPQHYSIKAAGSAGFSKIFLEKHRSGKQKSAVHRSKNQEMTEEM